MKLFMDLAQALAYQDKSPTVTFEHLRKAVRMLELENNDSRDVVLERLGIKPPKRSAAPAILAKVLEKYGGAPLLPVTEEVAQLLQEISASPTFYKRHALHTDRLTLAQAATLAPQVREFLNDRLHGQPQVVDALADGLMHKALRGERQGPLAALFLVGPPGTGKTHTVQLLAEALAARGEPWPMRTIDMSSMLSANQAFALTGMSKGYTDAIPGELTDFVRRNPRSIVVLDNLDKAHPNNQGVVLPVFDTGFLTDQFGFYRDNDYKKQRIAPDEVDFRNTIIIATTNAASGSLASADFQRYLEDNPGEATSAVLDLLANEKSVFNDDLLPSFSSELLSRLSSELMLIYRPLPLPALESIARATWDAFVANLEEATGCPVEATDLDEVLRAATLSFGNQLDARKVSGSGLENVLFDGVFDALQDPSPKTPISRVRFVLAAGFKAELARMLDSVGDADVVRELHRKQRKLEFDHATSLTDDGTVEVVFSDPCWKTPTQAADLGGRNGLQTAIPECGFEDIAGHERIKKRLQEVVRILRRPQQLKEWGIGLPRGMLLYGPPGTGKTMLAKAVAKEADLPFIAATGPEVLDIDRMHTVFERARRYAPAVLFIDEIDVLGSRAGAGYPIAINQLLAELDGFASLAGGVFTIAATNYPGKIDPAITRAGRLDLHFEVSLLDPPARRYFFEKLHALPGGKQLDLDELVRFSAGMSGADLERVRRELALDLVRTGKTALDQAQAIEMLSVAKYGERRDVKQIGEVLEHVACHEAGHAIVSWALFPQRAIEQITIVPRGGSAGFTAFQHSEITRPMTRDDVISELAVALAGRVAQKMKFGDEGIDQGASGDLLSATRLAGRAISEWGLDPQIGNRVLVDKFGSPATHDIPAERIEWWTHKAEERAQAILEQYSKLFSLVTRELTAGETLSGKTFEAFTLSYATWRMKTPRGSSCPAD